MNIDGVKVDNMGHARAILRSVFDDFTAAPSNKTHKAMLDALHSYWIMKAGKDSMASPRCAPSSGGASFSDEPAVTPISDGCPTCKVAFTIKESCGALFHYCEKCKGYFGPAVSDPDAEWLTGTVPCQKP
jgi:hypothetical protein